MNFLDVMTCIFLSEVRELSASHYVFIFQRCLHIFKQMIFWSSFLHHCQSNYILLLTDYVQEKG